MLRTCLGLVCFAGLGLSFDAVKADIIILFDFNGGPYHCPTPFDQTSGGITAHFTASGSAFSTQPADVMGITPAGFDGYCICPNSVSPSDLCIAFDQPLTDLSLLYSPQELATDSSCTMRITAYSGTNFVGTRTNTIEPPGTWPTGTLAFASIQPFDKVVVHYDKPPVTGGDYGRIFMVDNLTVIPVPEPAGWSLAAFGLGFGMLFGIFRSRCQVS